MLKKSSTIVVTQPKAPEVKKKKVKIGNHQESDDDEDGDETSEKDMDQDLDYLKRIKIYPMFEFGDPDKCERL